jgi:lipooligosaccharide transport system permease protein
MTVEIRQWQGSRKLVNLPKARRFGAWYVTEYRLRAMSKWMFELIGFGIGNPVIYLFAVGLGIGALINRDVDGVSYLAFIAPALLASAAIGAAMDECIFPLMEGFIWVKSFWTVSATQITPRQIAIGIWLSAVIRAAGTVALYLAVLLAFGAVPLSAAPALFITALLAGIGFGAAMLAATAYMVEDDQFFTVVARFIVMPMFLFSGTFYPLTSLPIYLQWIGWISPLWHATDLGRFLAYGSSVEPWLVVTHVVVLASLMVAGLTIAFPKFERRLAK